MYNVSAAFLAALRQSHTISTRADVLSGGVVVATLDITDGSVEVDGNNTVRRHCSVTLVDPTGTMTPSEAGDLLSPFGNEIALYRGIGDELVPLGVFGIATVDIEDK